MERERTGARTSSPRAVIQAEAVLDAAAGAAINAEIRAALGAGAERIDVDLRPVEDYDEQGTSALRDCRAASLPAQCSLHFLTGAGAGREALFLAFSDVDVETESLVE